jgi:hypothetical protein
LNKEDQPQRARHDRVTLIAKQVEPGLYEQNLQQRKSRLIESLLKLANKVRREAKVEWNKASR